MVAEAMTGTEAPGLSIDRIRRRLAGGVVGRHVYLFGEVSSTNRVLRQLAEAGAQEGTVVLAEAQTAGRGRRGQPWFSPPGLNLHASVLFRLPLPLGAVPVFAFIAALAVSDAVRAEGVPAGIRWPNDVLVSGRKVAGTLVETASVDGNALWIVLGVGVNVNVTDAQLRAGLGTGAADATSLREATGRTLDRNELAAEFLGALEGWYASYRTAGPSAVLAAWRERDLLLGRAVAVIDDGDRYEARAVALDPDGALVVEDAAGVRRRVITGRVRRAA